MNELCLQQCLALIEEKLGWGSSEDWLNQDFQLLSERIFEETRIRLSITTLKRVWGKVNYNSAPSISTLNTLANFIGKENWSTFKQSQPNQLSSPSNTVEKKSFKFVIPLIGLIIVTIVVALTAFDKEENPAPIPPELLRTVKFSSRPTAFDLPNSVIFDYDLGNVETDKAFIQQSWNKKLTFEIDKDGNTASAIYYLPGYFKAKLIAQDQILKEHEIHIKSDGWMGSIVGEGKPRYLYHEDLDSNGILKLSSKVFQEMHDYNSAEAKRVNFHYSEDLGDIHGDDFVFETTFKNTYKNDNGICQKSSVMIHGVNGAFIIPLSIPGCVSNLNVFHVGHSIDGKSTDLSAFGADFSDWQTLRCEASGSQMKIFINERLALEFETINPLGRIVGFKYTFTGAGEVDKLKLSRNEEVFFTEDFSQ